MAIKKFIKYINVICIMLLIFSLLGTNLHALALANQPSSDASSVRLTENELLDKLKGSWAGQMAGVSWGAVTEFFYKGRMLSDNEVPGWSSDMINHAFIEDDLYVEIPFLDAMKNHGADCDISFLADALKDSTFPLWHANYAAKYNLLAGIQAPDSGSWLYNPHCDDIDWQIEADFLGQMYPGLVNEAIQRSWEVGHIMCYGDGVYGGVFVAAMHAKAYVASSVDEVIEAGRQAVPKGSKFRELIDDVIKWEGEGLTWQETWQRLEDKWGSDDKCIAGIDDPINIDAKLNAGYVLIGLLYGKGDFEESMRISMMCGQDSDCNPSSVGGILGNLYGFEALPDKWKSKLDFTGHKFSYTDYNLDDAIDLNYQLAKDILKANGIELMDGVYSIPKVSEVNPPPLEQWDTYTYLNISGMVDRFSVELRAGATHGTEGDIKEYTWEFGDSITSKGKNVSHTYKEPGYYTITCTAETDNGPAAKRFFKAYIDKNIAKEGVPVISERFPTGGGSKDISIIHDGLLPDPMEGTSSHQYDTFAGKSSVEEAYVGYTFSEERTFCKVIFQEGMHFWDGGWFANGDLRVQVLKDDNWVDIGSKISPAYPVSNEYLEFGLPFEVYTFEFDEVKGKGIRVCGTPGGAAAFFSVAELQVIESLDDSDKASSKDKEKVPDKSSQEVTKNSGDKKGSAKKIGSIIIIAIIVIVCIVLGTINIKIKKPTRNG